MVYQPLVLSYELVAPFNRMGQLPGEIRQSKGRHHGSPRDMSSVPNLISSSTWTQVANRIINAEQWGVYLKRAIVGMYSKTQEVHCLAKRSSRTKIEHACYRGHSLEPAVAVPSLCTRNLHRRTHHPSWMTGGIDARTMD